MPKEVSLANKLVGQILTQENAKVGLRVQARDDWEYNDQGDGELGTITQIIDGEEEFGLSYNFVTVNWDNDDTFNYPLNEVSFIISDGKKKKTLISSFLEKAKLWDFYKLNSVNGEVKGLREGFVCQIIEVRNKHFIILVVDEHRNNHVEEFVITGKELPNLTFRKLPNYEKKAEKLMEEFATFIETPSLTKENIINTIKARYPNDIRQFLYVHNKHAYLNIRNQAYQVCHLLGISSESRITINDSIFGKTLDLDRCDRTFYMIRDPRIQNFTRRNYPGEHRKSYKQWLDFFEEISTKVVFNEKLKNVITKSNCNEKLKDFFIENNVKLNENFIDFDRASKKIMFTPRGKSVEFNDDGSVGGVRQSMSPHKFFGKYFKNAESVGEYDIKCFADEVVSSYGEYRMIEIEDGKIGEFYNGLRTITSCMTGKNTSLFRLYDDHPNIFKMFAIMLNGEVVGRTIRVTAKEVGSGKDFVYFDRLYYGNNEEVVQWFNSYCNNNGFTRKSKNSAEGINAFYNKENGNFKKRIYAEILDKGDRDFEHRYIKLPYLDTLRYGALGVLTNENSHLSVEGRFKRVKMRYTFDRADNEYNGKGYKGYCAHRDAWITEDVVEITEGSKYLNQTVYKGDAKKTETGYTFVR